MISGSDDLQQYRVQLKKEDEECRLDAYREIATLGIPAGVHLLLEGLSDPSPWVRSGVADLVSDIAYEEMAEKVLKLLRTPDPSLRSQVMTILTRMERVALKDVEACLMDEDTDVRIYAANILGNMGLKEAFPGLEKALKDPEENVRYAVVEAMGKIGERKAIPHLLNILHDEWARFPAVEALGLLGSLEAVPHLLALYEEDEWVHQAVLEALGNIGDPGQVDFLVRAMRTENEMIIHTALAGLAKIEQKSGIGALARIQEAGLDFQAIISSALQVHDLEIRKLAIWTLGGMGKEADLPALLEQLADFDEEIRAAAHQALISIGGRHLEAMLALYPGQEERVQKELIEILGEIGDKSAIPLVIEALENGTEPIRESAAKTMGAFRDLSTVEALIRRLNDSNASVRGACGSALGLLRAVKAIRPLIPLLDDPYADVREAASEALGKIGTVEVIKHCAPFLKHAKTEVRQAAVQCLGLIMDPRVTSHLISALDNSDRNVRRFAAHILGNRKIPQAAKPLVMALLDEDWQVRKSAASALGNLRDPRCIEALLDSLKDENIWVRYAAATALGRIGEPRAKPALHRCLKSDVGPVRIAAMEALWAMKDAELLSHLIPLSEDPDEEMRLTVAKILRQCSSSEGKAVLKKMSKDRYPEVRKLAEMPLEQNA